LSCCCEQPTSKSSHYRNRATSDQSITPMMVSDNWNYLLAWITHLIF